MNQSTSTNIAQITSVFPAAGVNGISGQQVTIIGAAFTGATAVKFGSYSATAINVESDTKITATIPTTVKVGTDAVNISVTTPGGTGISASNIFTFQDNYYISAISPNTGTPAGLNAVTITGKGFISANQVLFNGIPASNLDVVNDTSITCTVPQAAQAGSASVIVIIPSSPAPGETLINVFSNYTYYTPTITNVSPNIGSISGTGSNQLVTLSGVGFTGAKGVQFGGIPATSFKVVNDSTITTSVPAGAAGGNVNVQVISVLGTSTTLNPPADYYTYEGQQVTGVTPNNGPMQGSGTNQMLTISGIGFTGASEILFKGSAVTVTVPKTGFTVMSDTEIKTCVPSLPQGATAGVFDVQVSTPVGLTPVNAAADQYSYNPVPVIQSINPSTGSNTGGNLVTIVGSGFTGATEVLFGNSKASIQTTPSPTDEQIVVTSPAGFGTVDVTIITPNGQSGYISNDQYIYATIPFTFNIPTSLASTGLYISMFGELQQDYTNTSNTLLKSGTNVLLSQTSNGYDYVAVTSEASSGNNIPPFAVINSPLPANQLVVNIPNVLINAARLVYGVYQQSFGVTAIVGSTTLPSATITVNSVDNFPSGGGLLNILTGSINTQVYYTGINSANNTFTGCSGGSGTLQTGDAVNCLATPIINSVSNGTVTSPTPALQGNYIYDFFEFTYKNVAGTATMTINTSAIDQVGVPIILNVSGRNVQPGNQVGISLTKSDLISQYSQYTSGQAFNELIYPSATAQPVVRILSPADQMSNNPVQGLTASTSTTNGKLVQGTSYYYVVTAVINGSEVPASALMVLQAAPSGGAIDLAWGIPKTGLPLGTIYNVYRGVAAADSITWYQVSNGISSTSYTDAGPQTAGTSVSIPPFDLLYNYFDQAIENLFATTDSINLTVTDGSTKPANGLQYNLIGEVKQSPAWLDTLTDTSGNTVIQFTCNSIANNPNNIIPLIPINTLFYVFSPFFNSNTFHPLNSAPPSWNGKTLLYSNTFPTAMTFGANGVFADNAQQAPVLFNATAQPKDVDQNAYSVALGSIEDKLNAALLRGIALTINSVNWANSPTNLIASAGTPTQTGSSTTYYYVITALNSSGETTPSEEVSFTPNNTSVQLNWAPVNGASSYNLYRGISGGAENILVANTANTSFNDMLNTPILPSANTPNSGDLITVTNLSGIAGQENGNNLIAGTYYYMITVLNYHGESQAVATNEIQVQVSPTQNQVTLTWNSVANASAYKIYRGTSQGAENLLVGILQGEGSGTCTFTDGNNATQTPPPNIYYAPGTVSDIYAQFFHQTNVSVSGLAYAAPFDDQGDQSSTLTATSPYSVEVKFQG